MVKPESQTRQSSYYPHSQERRSTERRLIQDMEAQPGPVERENFEAVGTSLGRQNLTKNLTLEEIEQNFLKCYAAFLGAEVDDKMVWKSETFSQSSQGQSSHAHSSQG